MIDNLLTAPRAVSNMYVQVALSQSCANHAQHIERLSHATCHVACHVVRRDSSAIHWSSSGTRDSSAIHWSYSGTKGQLSYSSWSYSEAGPFSGTKGQLSYSLVLQWSSSFQWYKGTAHLFKLFLQWYEGTAQLFTGTTVVWRDSSAIHWSYRGRKGQLSYSLVLSVVWRDSSAIHWYYSGRKGQLSYSLVLQW